MALYFGGTKANIATTDGIFSSRLIPPPFNLEKASWAEVAALSESGNASKELEIGDYKTLTLSGYGTVKAYVAGFNHDSLSDGSGKAGITFVVPYLYSGIKSAWEKSTNRDLFINSDLNDYVGRSLRYSVPSSLSSVLKTVTKDYDGDTRKYSVKTYDCEMFPLSIKEIGSLTNTTSFTSVLGKQYSLFTKGEFGIIGYVESTGVANAYWVRDMHSLGDPSFAAAVYVQSTGKSGASNAVGNGKKDKSRYVRFGFCV